MATELRKSVIDGEAPVTLAECVYMGDGTANTIKDEIDSIKLNTNGSSNIVERVQSISSKFKNYKGSFTYSNYASNKTNSIEGDWWIWGGDSVMDFDFSIAYPGDVIYKSKSGIFKTHHIKKESSIVPQKKYDVCIVGGGAGGIGAAYALKDSGFRVCLVERQDVLGGTHAVAGVGMLIASPICNWYKSVIEEAFNNGKMNFYNNSTTDKSGRKVGNGSDFDMMWRAGLYTDDKNVINGFKGNHIVINDAWFNNKYYNDLSPTIDVIINTELQETHSTNGTIEYIDVKDLINGKTFSIHADYFIDCSGDGVLFRFDKNLELDRDYYIGTDPRDRFNEEVYPIGYTGDHYAINTVEPTYYQVEAKYIAGYSRLSEYPNPKRYKIFDNVVSKGNYGYKHPGANSTATIVSNSWGSRMSLQKFIEYDNSWNMADGRDRALNVFMVGGYTAGSRFADTCKMLAIREKYRVAAEKTVDQAYLLTKITSDNYRAEKTIALSTWWVDIHNQSYFCKSEIANGVPYESMIPKCYTNSLVACRAYGASHVALSSVRLVKTMMDMGYSAGIAINQLLTRDNLRGDVRTVDVSIIQDETGIGSVIQELETHFYKSTVDYTV